MRWSSGSDRMLLLRKVRERLAMEFAEVRSEIAALHDAATTQVARLDGRIDALRDQLLQARDVILAVRDEVVAARGAHASVAARLDTTEARLTALESPPPEEPSQ